MTSTIVVITDIHYGFNRGVRLGAQAHNLLGKFTARLNKTVHPDLVIDMGDRITYTGHDDDFRYMTALKDDFNQLSAPVVHLIGNHDVKFLSRAENESILNSSSNSHSMDLGGYHLVFWNPDVTYQSFFGLFLRDADIEWLESDLAKTDAPTILFSHVPLIDDGTEPQGPSGQIHHYFSWPQAPQVRKILEDDGKTFLSISGHRHKEMHREVNGIHHVVQQSFTHGVHPRRTLVPMRTWSALTLEDGAVTRTVEGRNGRRQAFIIAPQGTAPPLQTSPRP